MSIEEQSKAVARAEKTPFVVGDLFFCICKQTKPIKLSKHSTLILV